MRRTKGGWPSQNGICKNYLTCTKHGRPNTPDGTSKKQPKPRILELFLAVATPSIYTDSEVDKVARASTCVSCFRRAIADTKRNKHPLLLAEKTPQGIQTQLLADRKKRTSFSTVGIEHRCL